MSPSDLTPSLGQAETHPMRALLQLGLILVCLLLGGFVAVAVYGPSIMGSSLASSHFSTLNNRIRGVLIHGESHLSWTGQGHIQDLKLVGADEEEVLTGSVYVPPLLELLDGALIPGRVEVDLETLSLKIDEQGRFNLLENLVAKAGVDLVSPFLDPELLQGDVNFSANIDRLNFEDARSKAIPLTWPGGKLGIRWSPDGPGELNVDLDNGTLTAKLSWQGMGESFDLSSLQGKIEYAGASSELESLLGFPGGITGFMNERCRVSLEIGGGREQVAGEVPVEIIILDTVIHGMFDGQSFRMDSTGSHPFLAMAGFDGIKDLMEGVTAGMPSAIKDKLHLVVQDHGTWKWMLKGLQTGIAPLDPTLPLLEGILASSRLSLGFELPGGLALESRSAAGETLDLGRSTLDWNFDPETLGTGKLVASTALDPKVANLVLGVNKALRKGFELNWTGPSPMPSVGARMETASLSHTLTSFYARYLPAWGASLPDVLGASCSLEITRLDPNSPAAKHGGNVPSWQVKVAANNQLEEDFTFYVGEGVVWMEPEEERTLPLRPDQHAGIYETFFSDYLPWFASLEVNGSRRQSGDLPLDVTNLIFRGENLVWRLEEGYVELNQLDDVEYEIRKGWGDVWGNDQTLGLEPFAYEVLAQKVIFDQGLPFPVGSLEGSIDLASGQVDLELVQLNPLLEFLPGDFGSFVTGVKINGPLNDPECSMPMSGEDS